MIVGAVMVPHPPLAVPEIGKGEEQRIQKTLQAYEQAASFIASKRPDTVIVISPHALMYRDYFNVSDGRRAEGTFIGFGAGEVKVAVEYDYQFSYELTNELEENSFPGGVEYDRERDLSSDHGTMVPLYFLQQKYRDFKAVRIGLSGFPLTKHYEMGRYLQKMCTKLHRRAVIIASGDLSHCQKADGPYGYQPEGEVYDERIMQDMGSASFARLFDYEEEFLQKAMECGHRSFVMMAGALDCLNIVPHMLSHEATFGVGYGIVTYDVGVSDPKRNYLAQYLQKCRDAVENKKKTEDSYVRLARTAVEEWVRWQRRPSVMMELPEEMTSARTGVFVSLHEHGTLRGCIGTMSGIRENVAAEIIENAIGACSRDPRFEPVSEEELPYLEISVDVLGELERIEDRTQLDVKRFGILCECRGNQGVLLPDLEGIETVEQQIAVACRKGDIDEADAQLVIYRFEVIRHG